MRSGEDARGEEQAVVGGHHRHQVAQDARAEEQRGQDEVRSRFHDPYNRRDPENSSRRVLPAVGVSPCVDSLLVLCARADDATTAAWCDLVRDAVAVNPGGVVCCDVSQLTGSAVDVVNALARLQLTALHRGGRLRILRADPVLCALLDLVGLGDVF
jgi:hypothetical protein